MPMGGAPWALFTAPAHADASVALWSSVAKVRRRAVARSLVLGAALGLAAGGLLWGSQLARGQWSTVLLASAGTAALGMVVGGAVAVARRWRHSRGWIEAAQRIDLVARSGGRVQAACELTTRPKGEGATGALTAMAVADATAIAEAVRPGQAVPWGGIAWAGGMLAVLVWGFDLLVVRPDSHRAERGARVGATDRETHAGEDQTRTGAMGREPRLRGASTNREKLRFEDSGRSMSAAVQGSVPSAPVGAPADRTGGALPQSARERWRELAEELADGPARKAEAQQSGLSGGGGNERAVQSPATAGGEGTTSVPPAPERQLERLTRGPDKAPERSAEPPEPSPGQSSNAERAGAAPTTSSSSGSSSSRASNGTSTQERVSESQAAGTGTGGSQTTARAANGPSPSGARAGSSTAALGSSGTSAAAGGERSGASGGVLSVERFEREAVGAGVPQPSASAGSASSSAAGAAVGAGAGAAATGTGEGGSLRGPRSSGRTGGYATSLPNGATAEPTSRAEVIEGSAQDGFSDATYQRVFTSYRAVVEDTLVQSRVPEDRRQLVRRYFDLIRPRRTDEGARAAR